MTQSRSAAQRALRPLLLDIASEKVGRAKFQSVPIRAAQIFSVFVWRSLLEERSELVSEFHLD